MSDERPTIRVLEFKTETRNGKTTEWVKYAPVSAILSSATWARVDAMRPPEGEVRNDASGKKAAFIHHRWSMIEQAYDQWKSGQELPINGTPLTAWPELTADQARALKGQGLRTIEEVAAMTDTVITKIPLPNARELPKLARLFLENTGKAQAAEEMARRDEKISELEERLAAATELIEQLASKEKPKAKAKQSEAA